MAVDLLVDAKQHRAEHAVGDHLVEALVGEAVDRGAAGVRTSHWWRIRGDRRRRRWGRRRDLAGAIAAIIEALFVRVGMPHRGKRARRDERGGDREAAYELDHDQRPHSMPGSSPGAGAALARSVTLQSPADDAQAAANVQGGVLVFLMVLRRPLAEEVMIAVSPGCSSWMHWEVSVQTDDPPSCSTTVVLPRSERISRMVPRTPIVASGVEIL